MGQLIYLDFKGLFRIHWYVLAIFPLICGYIMVKISLYFMSIVIIILTEAVMLKNPHYTSKKISGSMQIKVRFQSGI